MAWFPLMIQIELWKEACEANQLSALLSVFFLQIHNWFTASLSEKALFTFVTNWDQAIFPLVLSFWCVAPESRIMYNIDIENDKHVRRYPRYCLLHFVKNRRFCSQQTKQEYTKEHKGTYLQIYIYKLITNILSGKALFTRADHDHQYCGKSSHPSSDWCGFEEQQPPKPWCKEW